VKPPLKARNPAGRPGPCKTDFEPNEPKVTVISSRSSARVENFLLSVPASQSQLVRSLPRPVRAKDVRLYSNKPPLRSYGVPTATKSLLAHVAGCWLFRVTEGDHVSYAVECGDRTWPFALLSSAETKFISVVNRGGAPWLT
jgi:hypothetical protein